MNKLHENKNICTLVKNRQDFINEARVNVNRAFFIERFCFASDKFFGHSRLSSVP